MTNVKDYSEFEEAARLLAGIMAAVPAPAAAAPPPAEPVAPGEPGEPVTRSSQLERVLTRMCQRGGFTGAIIADAHGLALAAFNTPVQEEALAAFTTVLGGALEKAASLLQMHDANNISLDISYTDKLVLRRFLTRERTVYLMILCPQQVDERTEIELSVDEITGILR
jgi:predicted regulator of Ras-like GTPase activity (Roadblock/LC7/MglB family)